MISLLLALLCVTNPVAVTSNKTVQVVTNYVVAYSTNVIVCTEPPPASGAWVRLVGGAGVDSAYGLATDKATNSIVVGSFQGTAYVGDVMLTSAGGSDIFVVKLDSSGTVLWAQRFGGTGDDVALGVAVDKRNGEVAVTGYFSGTTAFGVTSYTSTAFKDAFLVRLTSGGSVLWSKRIGTSDWSGSPDDYGYGVAVDPNNGDVVATGQFACSGLYDFGAGTVVVYSGVNTFLTRYDALGNLRWAKCLKSFSQDSGRAVAVDASGNVLVTGQTQGPIDLGGGTLPYITNPQYSNGYVGKYTASGGYVWSLAYGSTYGLTEGLGIAVDGSGDVAVAGRFIGVVGFGNGISMTGSLGATGAYLVKLSGVSGLAQWAKPLVANQNAAGRGVVIDGAGNISVVGEFSTSLNLGGVVLVSSGGNDGFVAQYSAGGVYQTAQRFGGGSGDGGNSLAVDAAGARLLAGYTSGGSFGSTNVITQGWDGFVWRQ